MPLQFLVSERGKPLLIDGGYLFTRNSETSKTGVSYWICINYMSKAKCPARCRTKDDAIIGYAEKGHSCEPNLAKIEARLAYAKMLQESSTGKTNKEIINSSSQNLSAEAIAQLPSVTSIKRRLCKARKTRRDVESGIVAKKSHMTAILNTQLPASIPTISTIPDLQNTVSTFSEDNEIKFEPFDDETADDLQTDEMDLDQGAETLELSRLLGEAELQNYADILKDDGGITSVVDLFEIKLQHLTKLFKTEAISYKVWKGIRKLCSRGYCHSLNESKYSYLKRQDCPENIHAFHVECIEEEEFLNLDLVQLEILVPEMGPRMKIARNLNLC